MNRAVAVRALVAAAVLLAGCASVSEATVGADGSVKRVVADGGGETYRMRLGARINFSGGDGTFSDLVVTGYAMNGTAVCRAEVGRVETGAWLGDDETWGETECDRLPAVLQVTGARVAVSEGARLGYVRFPAAVYVGRGTATEFLGLTVEPAPYRYRTGIGPRHRINRSAYDPRPTDAVFNYAKCVQYAADGDFAALPGDHPWTEGDPAPPDTREGYHVEVKSAPFDEDDAEFQAVPLASLPEGVRALVREARTAPGDPDEDVVDASGNLSERAFLRTHRRLLDESVSGVADLPGSDGDTYDAGRFDERRLDCREREYEGTGGHFAEYRVRIGGTAWRITLRYVSEWSGEVDVPTVPDNASTDPGGVRLP